MEALAVVTVAILYNDTNVESYVAVIQGAISMEDRQTLAGRFEAMLQVKGLEQEEDQAYMYFREVPVSATVFDVHQMPNVDGTSD